MVCNSYNDIVMIVFWLAMCYQEHVVFYYVVCVLPCSSPGSHAGVCSNG